MMCAEGERLRDAWYSTAIILDGEMDEARQKILERNRSMPEYGLAREKYVEHVAGCEECRRGFHKSERM